MVRYVLIPQAGGGGGASASEIWNYTGAVNSGTKGALLLSGGDMVAEKQANNLGNGQYVSQYFYGDEGKAEELFAVSWWNVGFSTTVGKIIHTSDMGFGALNINATYYGVPGAGYDNFYMGTCKSRVLLTASSQYIRAYGKNTDYELSASFCTVVLRKRWEKFSPRVMKLGDLGEKDSLPIEEIEKYNDLIGRLSEHRVVMREIEGMIRPCLVLEQKFNIEVNEENNPRRVLSYSERGITLRDLKEKIEKERMTLNKYLGIHLSPSYFGKISHPEDLGREMRGRKLETLLEIAEWRG